MLWYKGISMGVRLASYLTHHTLGAYPMMVSVGFMVKRGLKHRYHIFIRSFAQSAANVVFLVAEQTGFQFAISGKAQAIAAIAKVVRQSGYHSDRTLGVRKPVVSSGPPSLRGVVLCG